MSRNIYYTLITGASSGIGYELACEYAKHGHHLILSARSTAKLEELKSTLEKQFSIQVVVIPCDLSVSRSAKKLYDEIQAKGLKINSLVNNAGFGDHSEFEKSDLNKTLEMIQLNITTLTELTHLFIKDLKANAPSHVLNVASTAAFQAGPLMSVYYATKAYVLSFSEGLYEELKDKAVSVTALCPGPTISGFQDAANFSNNFISKIKLPTSKDVAVYGYQKAMQKQAIAVHGFMNRVLIFSQRFTPRSTIRSVVMMIQRKR